MESSASLAADAHQDHTETLRNIELEVDVPLGSLEEMDYYEQTMSQQDFLSENIDAELDDDRDFDIIGTTKGTMANFLKAVHRELREQVRGRAITVPFSMSSSRLVVTRRPGTSSLQEA